MSATLRCISSMATRQVLAELAAAHERRSGVTVAIESVGGVDAFKRVAAGETFDVVVLASDAIDKLIAAGHLQSDSRVDLVRSPVAIATRVGAPRPDISSEAGVYQAVLAARTIGFSTGPSGTYLTGLFERWGITAQIRAHLVQAPPGVPVAQLVARGEAELGFQQLSELMNVEGLDVIGTLPAGIAFITTFSAALCNDTAQTAAARTMLAFMTSNDADAAKQRHGMQSAETASRPNKQPRKIRP